MKKILLFLILFWVILPVCAQKIDFLGRKMVKSVKVIADYERTSFIYNYDSDGNLTSISVDINLLNSGYRLKTKLSLTGDVLIQKDEIEGDETDKRPAKRLFVMENERIVSKCLERGGERDVYDYEYDDGRLNSIWKNYRRSNSKGTFDYAVGVWRHMCKFVNGNFEGYSDQYYEYYIAPLPETMVRNVKDFYMLPKGSTQHRDKRIVFSNNRNDTNLCIESFLGAFPCYYMNGVEYTCDWMGMRSDFLPDYLPTTSMKQIGNKFVTINKCVLYNYDDKNNLTDFSIYYDHDNGDSKAYETLYKVEFEYVH